MRSRRSAVIEFPLRVGRYSSGSPTFRMSSIISALRFACAYAGLSRTWRIVKCEPKSRPMRTSLRASSSRPRSASAMANQKRVIGEAPLISIERRNQATASSARAMELRDANEIRPAECGGVARAQAQRLHHVAFPSLRDGPKSIRDADLGMGAGKIRIERQRPLIFSDAMQRAIGVDLHQAESEVELCVVGLLAQELVNVCSAALKRRMRGQERGRRRPSRRPPAPRHGPRRDCRDRAPAALSNKSRAWSVFRG